MKRVRWMTGLLALTPYALLFAISRPSQTPSVAPKVSFPSDVAPIFRAHCKSCHSGENAAGKLDLGTVEGMMRGGASGKCIVPGNPGGSLLLQRVLGKGGKARMPLGFPVLPDEQINDLKLWIAQGAKIGGGAKAHWAYLKPIRPSVPPVRNKSWVRNPIDCFVLANLEKNGLKPSPEASKETLIRRVSLDLIGLPPTPKEIDEFLADKRPDAYERLVDRLLASPHYGERQARPWLDLARYADSDGYEKDLNRSAYNYRDWVIKAFNKNLPYDKFTIDQLAGDLIPSHSLPELVATGFNRNTMLNREGGVDRAEALFQVMLDRVGTTATVWLGTTLQCARCHDHKYDPFTQKDFYSMMAFYNDPVITKRGSAAVGEENWFEADAPVPTPEQAKQIVRLKAEINKDNLALNSEPPDYHEQLHNWIQEVRQAKAPEWTILRPDSVTAESGANLTAQADGSILASGNAAKQDEYLFRAKARPGMITGLRIELLTDSSLSSNGPGRADNGNFVLTNIGVKVSGQPVQLNKAFTDFTQDQFNADLALVGDRDSGWAVYGQLGKSHTLVLTFANPVSNSKGDIAIDLEQRSPYDFHTIGHFRISATDAPVPEFEMLPQDIVASACGSNPDESKLETYFKSIAPCYAAARNEKAADEAAFTKLMDKLPSTLVMKDKPHEGPLTAFIHSRGEFLSPTTKVIACTPEALPPMSATMPRDRLGLAEWIVSKDNPLTARVEVNRMWELYFGRGIVETSEDFGTQGSRPSNQPLLDWLATEFMRRNWDMKAMNRLIVTSATYRQSSDATPALMKRDPQNILLARGPRFRMEAEMIHDVALSAGGILNLKIGGPSVMPYQPEGVWNTPANDERWHDDMGSKGERRGLYTFWKRSAPYPNFVAFDATSREECTVRRIRTNTPLQALAMLNDKLMFESAEGLGKRMMAEGGPTEASRLIYGYRVCTGRKPDPTELRDLEAMITKLKGIYDNHGDAWRKFANSPDQAVYDLAANVMLNMDETLTKE